MSCRKTFLLVLLLTLATGLHQLPAAASGSGVFASSKEDLILLPLVGEKVTLTLQNGETVGGTLWDFTDTMLTLKIKKGLLYSKAEQFKISEIKYLEDPEGKKHDLSIIFHKSTTSSEGTAIKSDDKDIIENTLQIVTFTDDENSSIDDKQDKPAVRIIPEPVPEFIPPPVEKEKPVPASRPVVASPEPSKVNKPAKKVATTPNPPATRSKSKKSSLAVKQPPSPESREVAAINPDKVEALQYQNYILYASVLMLLAVFIVYKSFGLKSTAFAKESLFPTRMIRTNGPYGIIDQGREDGVRVDDVVKLYRKSDNQVQYKGKVRVTKVAQNYSAVEIISTKGEARIGAGDVGIRDRNRVGSFLRKIRMALSKGLAATAQGLAATAKNIAGERTGQMQNGSVLEPKHESEIHEVTEMVRNTRIVDLPQSYNDRTSADIIETDRP